MKVGIQEYLRQYFIQTHGIDQADAALLILDPEFGTAIEPLFLEAVGEMIEFELPIQNTPNEIIAKMHNFCDSWIEKYDDQRRLKIQEYLRLIKHPAAGLLSNHRALMNETPIHIKIISFAFWGCIILFILWLLK